MEIVTLMTLIAAFACVYAVVTRKNIFDTVVDIVGKAAGAIFVICSFALVCFAAYFAFYVITN